MSAVPAWSFSSLNDFQNCPRAYQLKRVTKEVVQTESEAMRYGTECHLFLENRMMKKDPLPAHLEWLETMMQTLERSGGLPFTEQRMCVTKGLQIVDFFDKSAWCRGVMDVGVRYKDKSVVMDYKTGKRKFDTEQLMLFAGFEFAYRPEIDLVKTGYVWLKDKKIDSESYTRDDVPRIWGHFIPKVERLASAYETGVWPAKPSGLCNPWCPATKAQCSNKK